MKKILFCLHFLLLLSIGAFAQTTASGVSNVKIQISEERDKATITYDLARVSQVSAYNVAVKILLDGESINAIGLSGDLGPNIAPGFGKRIIWDIVKDVILDNPQELKVEVMGTPVAAPCMPMKTVPVYAGLAGVAATGAGLFISGLGAESNSKEIYQVYKDNPDPNDAVFSEMSRDDHYTEANKKHKQGTWLMIGGGAILAAGGFVMISRLAQVNRYNKDCASRGIGGNFKPRIHFEPVMVGDSYDNGIGLALTLKF